VMQQLGKYQLIRKLATGGMAEVYLAKAAGPMGFEKTLVLKRILPHLAEDPAFVEMFLSEAKLAAQLNHPNIVQIFDFGESDDEYFLAMEFIDGPNLRVLIKRAVTQGLELPPALCARLIASACEGLAFAHDFRDPATGELLGLIHRDISPDNILVSRQGAVKVVDFGIAKAAGQSHKTQSGVIKGKLAYMPPEQVRAKTLDRRVDVYALGVVFYELLTGHKPFETNTDASLMQAILFEPLIPASQRRSDLPEAVHQILDRALAKDREQRYPDCLALAADLEEFILSVGRPVTTQQIVQLLAQIIPSAEGPMPTPQSGTPRSNPKHSATPVHTPAPVNVGTGPGARSKSRPGYVPRTGDMVAPAEAEPPEEAPMKTVPLTTPEMLPPTEPVVPTTEAPYIPPAPRRLGLMVSLLLGALLLVAGGGLLLARSSSAPAPVPPPAEPPPSPPIAEATPPDMGEQPAAGTPTLPSEPVAASPAREPSAEPGPEAPPSPEPNPLGSTPPDTEQEPLQVAAKAPPSTRTEPVTGTRPSRPPSERSASASKSSRPVGKGTVTFRVRPYATVIIDGKNMGQTPFSPVELSAGTHRVTYINDDLGKKVTETIEVKAGETLTIKKNLEE
jgi:eukaryotic-like serine/threonine-protein kinase